MTESHAAAPLDPALIGFRPLALADLPLMHRWLTTPHVARWWYDPEPITLEWVIAKYTPRIAGHVPTHCFVILHDRRPIGFIQTYRLADHPDYDRAVEAGEDAAGVDLFIGEPDAVHRGLGAPVLRRFLAEIVFARWDVASCIIGPEPKNTAAIRAYEKAGFQYLKTVQVGDEPAPEYLMRLARDEVSMDSRCHA